MGFRLASLHEKEEQVPLKPEATVCQVFRVAAISILMGLDLRMGFR